jgi:hypothetical protein
MPDVFSVAFSVGPGTGVVIAAGASVVGSCAFSGLAATAQRDTKAARIANRFMIISLRGWARSFDALSPGRL